MRDFYGKPYYSLDAYCKETFGEKVYKIALDAGMTCPNRDGRIDTRGCIFCSAGGSGDFAAKSSVLSSCRRFYSEDFLSASPAQKEEVLHKITSAIHSEIQEGRKLFQGRMTSQKALAPKKTGSKFIAYFQSYTNTYAPIPYLYAVFSAAFKEDCVVGISVGTRPDCMTEEVCVLFNLLKKTFPGKFIWVELGLQTMHESTALYIRQGYTLSCFETALQLLKMHNLPVIVHVILGLPGETSDMMLDTIHYLNRCGIWGIKLQLLHVLKGTDLAFDYEHGKFDTLSFSEYLEIVMTCLSQLSPEIVVHRLTGDGPKSLLLAPLFSCDKRKILNTLHREMKRRGITQGCCFTPVNET